MKVERLANGCVRSGCAGATKGRITLETLPGGDVLVAGNGQARHLTNATALWLEGGWGFRWEGTAGESVLPPRTVVVSSLSNGDTYYGIVAGMGQEIRFSCKGYGRGRERVLYTLSQSGELTGSPLLTAQVAQAAEVL